MEIVSSSISPLSKSFTVTSSSLTIRDFISSFALSVKAAGTLATGLVIVLVAGGFILTAESTFSLAGILVLVIGLIDVFVTGFSVGFFLGITELFFTIGGLVFFTAESLTGGSAADTTFFFLKKGS